MSGEEKPPLLRPMGLPEVRACWDWLRKGLAEVRAKCDSDWMPEDVYAVVRAGQAQIFEIAEGAGFMVCQRQERFGGPCLLIWAIHGELAPFEQALYAEIDALARSIGVRTVEAQGRKGWAKRGYFRETVRVYVRDIEPQWAAAAAPLKTP